MKKTNERLKKRFAEQGLERAIGRKPLDMSDRPLKFAGASEGRLAALACSKAPEGDFRWTVRLLAEKAVELEIPPEISDAFVHRILKKRM
jgi:hypothetical protein